MKSKRPGAIEIVSMRQCPKRGNAGVCIADTSGRCGWCDGVITPLAACTGGQLDTRGARVELVALRVGAVVTEHDQFGRVQHEVRLYQIGIRPDDRVPYPVPTASVPGSTDLRLSIVGALPAGLEPGALLRLLVVEPRNELSDEDRASLEQLEAAAQ